MNKFNIFFSALISIILIPCISFSQASGTKPDVVSQLLGMVPMFLVVFFIFYFLVIKPQNQKQKAHNDLLSSLKKGDIVVTSGGMIVKVFSVEDKIVFVENDQNTKFKFEKDHIVKKFTN